MMRRRDDDSHYWMKKASEQFNSQEWTACPVEASLKLKRSFANESQATSIWTLLSSPRPGRGNPQEVTNMIRIIELSRTMFDDEASKVVQARSSVVNVFPPPKEFGHKGVGHHQKVVSKTSLSPIYIARRRRCLYEL